LYDVNYTTCISSCVSNPFQWNFWIIWSFFSNSWELWKWLFFQ